MDHTVEDEGPGVIRLQGAPRKSGKRTRPEAEGEQITEGEYWGKFEEYCRSKGIRLEFTVPKTPKLNGLGERMNRTIMERVWSMLAHAKLPKTF